MIRGGCGRACRPQPRGVRGYTVAEVLFALGLIAILAGAAIPQLSAAIDRSRAFAAARYVASRLMLARMMAVQRSAAVAIRFDRDRGGFRFATYQDGNRNGVRTRDIDAGVDRQVDPPVGLAEMFNGVEFGLDVDGEPDQPIQLGGTALLTFTPGGTSTSGSVYLRGRDGSQYVVRVLGATGRSRVLFYDPRQRRWTERF